MVLPRGNREGHHPGAHQPPGGGQPGGLGHHQEPARAPRRPGDPSGPLDPREAGGVPRSHRRLPPLPHAPGAGPVSHGPRHGRWLRSRGAHGGGRRDEPHPGRERAPVRRGRVRHRHADGTGRGRPPEPGDALGLLREDDRGGPEGDLRLPPHAEGGQARGQQPRSPYALRGVRQRARGRGEKPHRFTTENDGSAAEDDGSSAFGNSSWPARPFRPRFTLLHLPEKRRKG